MNSKDALTIFENPWIATEEGLDRAENVTKMALGKRIPKKISIETKVNGNVARCSCGFVIGEVSKIRYEYSFCPYCGQAIKWSEE